MDDSITRHEEGPMRAQVNGLTRTDFEMNMSYGIDWYWGFYWNVRKKQLFS